MSTYVRKPEPPLVKQPKITETAGMSCWLDALTSWVIAAPKQPWWVMQHKPSNEEGKTGDWVASKDPAHVRKAIKDQFSIWIGPQERLQLEPKGRWSLEFIAASLNMELAVFDRKHKLTANFALDKIRRHSCLWMFFFGNRFTQNRVGHAVVVYGVTHQAAPKEPLLHVMDPWPTEGYRQRNLSYFTESEGVVVGWQAG